MELPFVGIDIIVNSCPHNSTKKISYFDLMTNELFAYYKELGATSKDEFIIPKEDRDLDPLFCVFETNPPYMWIKDKGNIPNYVHLGNETNNFQIVSEI